jgi:hypothetical protein
MAAATVITIIKGTLKVGTSSPPTTAADCQIVSAALKANPVLNTLKATFCAGESQVAGQSGYELDITALQDWTLPTGFSQFCFANDAKVVYWELTLDGETTPTPKAQLHGTAYCVAMDFGGDAGTPLEATLVWPVIGKPVAGPATLEAAADAAPADATAA